MNREWVAAKEAESVAKAQAQRAEIVAKINSAEFLTDEDKKALEDVLDTECKRLCGMFESSAILRILENHDKEGDNFPMDFLDIVNFVRSLKTDKYESAFYKANGGLKRYLDSEPMEFDGDIIITDPCYIMLSTTARHHSPMTIGAPVTTEETWKSWASTTT